MDTRNNECVWRVLCMAYSCDKEVPGLSMAPNCHYYHCKYDLNNLNGVLLAKVAAAPLIFSKHSLPNRTTIPVVVLMRMALTATEFS